MTEVCLCGVSRENIGFVPRDWADYLASYMTRRCPAHGLPQPFYEQDALALFEGDCRDVMARWPEASIDAIVCDPPYGLEFMGKDWDKLDDGLPQAAVWRGRRGRGGSTIGDDASKPASRSRVSLGGKRPQFRRCQVCGRREFSGTPCQCESPEWTIEYPDGAPSGMIRMQRWHEAWAREAYRVLKPGAHLVAFGAPRTYHRLAAAIEDAGFEIRDSLLWLFGSGFPKSLDVSKAIDKAAGAEREIVGHERSPYRIDSAEADRIDYGQYGSGIGKDGYRFNTVTAPATPDAVRWQGWGTALKPAYEPIVLARKPLSGTVAANVQQHGTGALNIDGTRIGTGADKGVWPVTDRDPADRVATGPLRAIETTTLSGRWPANVLLDDEAARLLDAQSGEQISHSTGETFRRSPDIERGVYSAFAGQDDIPGWPSSRGGASRFFYTAKASRAEREFALDDLEEARRSDGRDKDIENPRLRTNTRRNDHPTVKPVDVMRWLCRLVTPPNGLILDPFVGSGSTGMAALDEGFGFVGIDLERRYLEIARRRIARRHALEALPQVATGQGRLEL